MWKDAILPIPQGDGGRGISLLESGLYPTIDDLAKLTTLLQRGDQHQGWQLLSATKLAEALYKTRPLGLPSSHDNRFGEGRYHLSFWSVPYRTSRGWRWRVHAVCRFCVMPAVVIR